MTAVIEFKIMGLWQLHLHRYKVNAGQTLTNYNYSCLKFKNQLIDKMSNNNTSYFL